MTNLPIALIHMLKLLQCPNIIQNRVFYKKIQTMEPVGPQTLYMMHTAMASHKEKHQRKEHVSWKKCMKSYHKTIRDKREMSLVESVMERGKVRNEGTRERGTYFSCSNIIFPNARA